METGDPYEHNESCNQHQYNMNITRDNYEMFFLLYVDNELSAQERTAVDTFVEENTDLKTELDMLLQTALPAEAVSFGLKDKLYKEESSLMQEKMLLLLDNELDNGDAGILSSEIRSIPSLKQEWEILQRTKLDKDDRIVFENKDALYRRENSRVITMGFWRVAAAAVFIGVALYVGGPMLFNNKQPEDIASANKNANGKSLQSTLSTKKTNGAGLQTVPENNALAAVKVPVNVPVETISQPVRRNVKQAGSDHAGVQDNAINLNQPGSKRPGRIKQLNAPLENFNKDRSNETTFPIVDNSTRGNLQKKILENEIAVNDSKEKTMQPLSAPDIEISTVTANRYATAAMLTDSQEEQNNDKILFMDEEKLNRSKLSGLIRKVKRVIERKTNIKTGNGIKIAGFEIAAR